MPAEPALVVEGLTVTLGGHRVLNGLSLHSVPGITAILGSNGAGKTTTVRVCTGLIEPDAGAVRVLGSRPGSVAVLPRVGLMPQSAGAWSGVTARELLRFLASLHSDPLPVADLLSRLRLTDAARTPYRRLSGGQQQAVNLAGALVGRPELVFLDEPTAGMDPHLRRNTWALLEELRSAGVAVILTTHAMDEATALADHVWVLHSGRIVLDGSVGELTATAPLEDVFLRHTGGGLP